MSETGGFWDGARWALTTLTLLALEYQLDMLTCISQRPQAAALRMKTPKSMISILPVCSRALPPSPWHASCLLSATAWRKPCSKELDLAAHHANQPSDKRPDCSLCSIMRGVWPEDPAKPHPETVEWCYCSNLLRSNKQIIKCLLYNSDNMLQKDFLTKHTVW